MQPLQSREVGPLEESGENSEAGSGCAGIVNLGDSFGVFGIDTEPGGDAGTCREDFVAVAMLLADGVENDVVCNAEEGCHFRRFVGGGKDVDFAPELLRSETGFVDAARGSADEVVSESRVESVAGKGFLREKDLCPCFVLNPFQDLTITTKEGLVEDKRGCLETAPLKCCGESREVTSVESGFGMVGHGGRRC